MSDEPTVQQLAAARWRSGPLQRTHRLPSGYMARLYFAPNTEDGKIYWVCFDLVKIQGYHTIQGRGSRFSDEPFDETSRAYYERRDHHTTPDPVYSLDEAHLACWGHVKWDGCMELRHEDHAHFCGLQDLQQLLFAIEEVREKCADEMSDATDIHSDYVIQ